MKKIFFLLLLALIFTINANAQVIIGSMDPPTKGAVLELKSAELGFLLSRVNLVGLSKPNPMPSHVQGMVVFNLTNSPADTLHLGIYYNTGEKWVRFSSTNFNTNWFYMPSIALDVSTMNAVYTVNLYDEYEKQFKTGTKIVSNTSAPNAPFAVVPKKEDFYYYITEYDDDVFDDVEVSDSGILKYTVREPASDKTFMNIVFVVK